jgi:hypothetical protein
VVDGYALSLGLKGVMMKKKLLVLMIAAIPMLIPNLASAIVIDIGSDFCQRNPQDCFLG